MIVASGGGPVVPMGPTATHIFGGIGIAFCVLVVLGYYGQKLQWWLQDRRSAKEKHSTDHEPSGEA
jgi:hypothetical protein